MKAIKQAIKDDATRNNRQQNNNNNNNSKTTCKLKADAASASSSSTCLIGLKWQTRLTIILIGACILFSIFFGLEFLISKLVGGSLVLLPTADASKTTTKAFIHESSHRESDLSEGLSFCDIGRAPSRLDEDTPKKQPAPVLRCHARLIRSPIDWLDLKLSRWLTVSSKAGDIARQVQANNNDNDDDDDSARSIQQASNNNNSGASSFEWNLAPPPPLPLQTSNQRRERQQQVSLHSGGGQTTPPAAGKLGVNFELIYEQDLQLSSDGKQFVQFEGDGVRMSSSSCCSSGSGNDIDGSSGGGGGGGGGAGGIQKEGEKINHSSIVDDVLLNSSSSPAATMQQNLQKNSTSCTGNDNDSNNNSNNPNLVRPELKLGQLLEGYHVAMPFNPDIWSISEPQQHLDLLTGEPRLCLKHLNLLFEALERSLNWNDDEVETAAVANNLSGSQPKRPATNGNEQSQEREAAIAAAAAAKTNWNPLERIGWQHYQLMKLLDSFGRPESGTLGGHPFWLGSYLQCKQLNELPPKRQIELLSASSYYSHSSLDDDDDDDDDDDGRRRPRLFKLQTRYCVGKLVFKSWLREAHNHHPSSIKVGLCLPNSCDTLALFESSIRSANNEANLTIMADIKAAIYKLVALNLPQESNKLYSSQHFQLTDAYCLPEQSRRHLGIAAFLLILLVALWLACMLICTRRAAAAVASNAGANAKLLSKSKICCFEQIMSMKNNLHLFLSSIDSDSNKCPANCRQQSIVNLHVLDSVKHIGCVGVILAHVLLTYLTLGTAYNHTIETIGKDLRTMLLLSLNNVVDTFFVISGLLASYLIFKKLDNSTTHIDSLKNQPVIKSLSSSSGIIEKMRKVLYQYGKILFGRYVRMAPLYFLVYTFAKTISVHLGSGPLWDYATNSESLRGLCRQESWWWPILFASDLKPITFHCVPPAWSMSVDLQFFTLLPLFVMLLRLGAKKAAYKRKIILNILFTLLVVLSSAITLFQYRSLLDYVSLKDFAKLRLHVFTVLIRHAAHAYSQPQNRMGPILIGLIGGHLLYEHEARKRRALATAAAKYETGRTKEKHISPLSTNKLEADKDDNKSDNGNFIETDWPFWMRGKWFRMILLVNLTFVVAPCLVQIRERARRWQSAYMETTDSLNGSLMSATTEPETPMDMIFFEWLFRRVIDWILALGTSIKFDCYLALGGFVLIKPLWSLCNCIIFLRLATDLNRTLLARLMSMKCWQILSKLNYAILLVHFELIAYESMSRLSVAQPITWSYLMCKFCYAYLFSLLFAAPLYILFEQPMNRLIGHYLMQQKQYSRKQEGQEIETSSNNSSVGNEVAVEGMVVKEATITTKTTTTAVGKCNKFSKEMGVATRQTCT